MNTVLFPPKGIIFGENALAKLKELSYRRAFIVTGGSSMTRFGIIDRATKYLEESGTEVFVFSGVSKNPTTHDVMKGLAAIQEAKPDVVIAIGGGSAIDCAKCITLFYEFPEINFGNVLTTQLPQKRNTVFIAVPSTSGTGSEATHVSVITDTEKNVKFPIKTNVLRPDMAILDGEIAATMPAPIAAETGMDALGHAIECYTNDALDPFTEVIAREAVMGIMKWLPISYETGSLEARSKMHLYQCMAGIAFSNVGLSMVHGIALAFGGKYNYSHGRSVAIALPFVLEYNRRSSKVTEKLKVLSAAYGCDDIVEEIYKLKERVGIPAGYAGLGLDEETYRADYQFLLDHSMLGSTLVNPVEMTKETMADVLNATYWGNRTLIKQD